eukprot:7391570-Prymnesium_polylepis.4
MDLVADIMSENRENAEFKGILFVEQVALTMPLAHLLNRDLREREIVAAAKGCSGTGSMSDAECRSALEDFKSSRVQLLVCTSALEEGIDVSSCEFVVRFSKMNTTKSFIQGSGRARKAQSVVYAFMNDVEFEQMQADRLDMAAKDRNLQLTTTERLERIDLKVFRATLETCNIMHSEAQPCSTTSHSP